MILFNKMHLQSFVKGKLLLIVFAYLMLQPYNAPAQNADIKCKHRQSGNWIQDKNFYFFTLLEKNKKLVKEINKNAYLKTVFIEQCNLFDQLPENKNNNIIDYIAQFKWPAEKISTIANEFVGLYHTSSKMKQLVQKELRQSGDFALYNNLPDDSLLQKVWIDAANGLNYIITAYTKNSGLKYPEIDSTFYNSASDEYHDKLYALLSQIKIKKAKSFSIFMQPSLAVAIDLLIINKRDEAARHEPLEKNENLQAFRYAKTIDWSKYAYSAIIAPGAGNKEYNIAISEIAKQRCVLAAASYKSGKAPFIIVSGGYVHPNQTPFCEAIEMKKYLMSELSIPEKVIFIEPFARHTTTNIRNCSRIIFWAGMPVDKKILIVSTESQIAYIINKKFPERCINELKLVPYNSINQNSGTEIEITFSAFCLHINSLDPLDP